MITDDFDRTVRGWLDDGPTTMSDRALQAALDEIHVTRQRRAWWPARRISAMSNTFRIAAGVAAIALVTVVGLSLVPAGGLSGIAPAPTPTPTAIPTPVPTPSLLTVTSATDLQPGTYITAAPFGARVTFTVPSGWTGSMGGPYQVVLDRAKGDAEVAFSIFDDVAVDPCHADKGFLDPPAGPTVSDLARALARMPGLTATTPTDVTLGGVKGQQLTLTAPASSAGCTLTAEGEYLVWRLPLGATMALRPDAVDHVRVLDVDGIRLVVDTLAQPGQTPAAQAETQAILASLQIAPAPSPSPSGSSAP